MEMNTISLADCQICVNDTQYCDKCRTIIEARQLSPTAIDVGYIIEYGLIQKLSTQIRCF